MGDNVPNIILPATTWVDLYSASGIDPGVAIQVENVGSYDVFLTVQSVQPAVDHDSYNVVQRGNGIRLQNAPGATGAWAFCNNVGGKVAVGLAQQDGFFQSSGSIGSESVNPPNSTMTPLGAGETYTGEWINTVGIGIVYVSVYSDQASAEDGCIIEQSTDAVNADFDDVFTVTAGSGKNFAINPHARFLRVKYINGSVAQTEFRLQTKLNKNGLASTHRIKDDITNDDDARLVKNINAGKNQSTGNYENIESYNKGLIVYPAYKFDVAQNLYLYRPDLVTTLSADASVGDVVLNVTSVTGAVVGEAITIYETNHICQTLITAVGATTITVATPLDYAFTTAAEVECGPWNMAVNGSVTPQIFILKGPPTADFHIHSINGTLLDQSAMDDSLFGGQSALTNGIYYEFYNAVVNKIFGIIVNNIGFFEFGYDIEYSSKAPAGYYGFRVKMIIPDIYGVKIVLDYANRSQIRLHVRDDLTLQDQFTATLKGNIVPY